MADGAAIGHVLFSRRTFCEGADVDFEVGEDGKHSTSGRTALY